MCFGGTGSRPVLLRRLPPRDPPISQFARKLLSAVAMHRLLAFFGCLAIVLSLAMGSVAHARESAGYVEISAQGIVTHSAGDSDELPADADKAYPHHHADCHGHQVGVATDYDTLVMMAASRVRPLSWDGRRLARGTIDPALRPPQA
jgi:hypothetical protein